MICQLHEYYYHVYVSSDYIWLPRSWYLQRTVLLMTLLLLLLLLLMMIFGVRKVNTVLQAYISQYSTGVLISPQPDQEGNQLQRQKILSFIYRINNNNWRNISTIYIYITRLTSNEIFSPSNKIHREIGRAKDLSAPLYKAKDYLE